MGLTRRFRLARGQTGVKAGAHRSRAQYATFSTRRRRLRMYVVTALLLLVLTVGGSQVVQWSGEPAEAKDCIVRVAPAGPLGEGPLLREVPEAYPGTLHQQGGTVNDASCLNRTAVYGVVRPQQEEDVRVALAHGRDHALVVSVGGTGHSMGGQASHPGALVLDMRGLDRVRVDPDARTVTVQAGATWHQVLEAVHPMGLSVATMPSIDVLSVGGTVSVNAHGLDFRAGSLSSTIRSLRVMLADGTVHQVSREREPELFRAVVGGYGLLGVVLDVELDLVDSEVYRLNSRVIDTHEFPDVFSGDVADDPAVRMTYTHLSTSPSTLLQEAIVYTYTRLDAAEPVPQLRARSSDRFGRLVLNLARTGDLGQRIKWSAQRDLLPHVRGCVQARNEALRQAEACLVARNQAMFESLGLLSNRLTQYTDILHEYFLPSDQLVPFLADLREQLGTHDAQLLNASIRHVHASDITLDYAQGERFSLVLYLSQEVSEAGNTDMAQLTRELVAGALRRGGTFYLPYQQHYTREQVAQAYPKLDQFFALKRRHDPGLLFQNSFFTRFG